MSIKKFSEFASDNLDLSSSAFKLAGYRAGAPNTNIVVPASNLVLNADYEVYPTSATVTIDAKNKKHVVISHTYSAGLTDLNIVNATPGQELLIIIVDGGGTADIGINSFVTNNAVIWPASPQITPMGLAAYALRVLFPPLGGECDVELVALADNYPIVKNVKVELIAGSVVWNGDPGNEWPPEIAALLSQPLYFPVSSIVEDAEFDEVYVNRSSMEAAQLADGAFSFNNGQTGYTEIWEWTGSEMFNPGLAQNLPSVAINGPFDNADTDNLPDNHFVWLMDFSNGNFTVVPLAEPLACGSEITRPVSFRQRPYTSPATIYTQGHGTVKMTAVLDSEVPV